jgi:hypothetical protein
MAAWLRVTWLEVHDMHVEVIVCGLGQQLPQHKDLAIHRQDRLLLCVAVHKLGLASLRQGQWVGSCALFKLLFKGAVQAGLEEDSGGA